MSNINIVVAAQVNDAVSGLNEVQKATKRVGDQVNTATSRLKSHTSQYSKAAVATNKWAKGALQQAGYQVGDFAVQVANGTSGIQAFGQQGSQLLGVFGPIGAVLGAGVAIFSAVALAAQKTAEASGEAGLNIDKLKDAVSSYSSVAKGATSETYQLAKEFGDAAFQASTLFKAQQSLAQIKAVNAVSEAMRGLRSEFGDFGGVSSKVLDEAQRTFLELGGNINNAYKLSDAQFKRATDALSVYNTGVKDLQRQLGIGQVEAFDLASSLASLAETTNLEDTVAELQAVYNTFSSIVGGVENATEEQRLLMQKIIDSAIATLKLKVNMDGVGESIDDASGKMTSFGKAALSVVDATYRLNRGILPPQARADLKTLDTSYEDARKRIEDAAKAAGSGSSTRGKGLTNVINTELSPAIKRQTQLADYMGDAFGNSLMSVVDGTNSVKDAFRSMATDIIKELYRVFVVKRITGLITGAFGGSQISGPSLGIGSRGNFAPPPRPVKAIGGPVQAGKPYTVGERGPEMFVPSRSGSIIPNDKMSSGGNVIVNQTINVSTGVQQTVRTEIKSLMPQIAESAKAAVADAKRRGGSYGRAFA